MDQSQHGIYSFEDADPHVTVAHEGAGQISFARVIERAPNPGINYVDLSEIPPGSSIGIHTHGDDDEEIYVVISGRGTMTVDDASVEVGPGAVIVNRPGGQHGLANTGFEPLRLAVIDVGAGGRTPSALSRPSD